jgi:epoxyqueuosine reductase QueG
MSLTARNLEFENPDNGYLLGQYPKKVENPADLADYLAYFTRHDPRNHLPEGVNAPIFDEPVLGVASADDPLFSELSRPEVVGPIHVTPKHWLSEARSVISFFAPFSKEIRESYRNNPGHLPTLEWVSGRLNGEIFLNVLRRALYRLLTGQGAKAHIPNLDPSYRAENLKAMWSERHVAFVSGVGTFALHCGIITRKGTAGRIGSVVTDAYFEPTARPYGREVYGYCLYKNGLKCQACVKKCPAGAIAPEGKDHLACSEHGHKHIRPAYREWGYHACGHCQNNLPCSPGIPAALERKYGLPG